MGNCTLGHSEHRHGLDAAWETEREQADLFSGAGHGWTASAQPEEGHGRVWQLLRPESVMPTNQTPHGKRRQGKACYHAPSPRAQTCFSLLLVFQTNQSTSTLKGKGIVLCLLHPLNKTGKAPKAQGTEGRTPRHPSP